MTHAGLAGPEQVDLSLVMRHARIMARRSAVEVPADLRARLETARLDLLALFRALDRMDLTPSEIPQRLIQQLFELDADYVEALWALDRPPGTLDLKAMLRRYAGCSRTIARRLHAIAEESSSACSSPLGPTGSHCSSEPGPG